MKLKIKLEDYPLLLAWIKADEAHKREVERLMVAVAKAIKEQGKLS